MPFEFTVSDIIPASPQEIYDAWLDSVGHEKITGGKPATITATPGAAFTVWDKYITGRNLVLERPSRIVQTWRTTRFAKDDPDSFIEVRLKPVAGGTQITVKHASVPDGQIRYRDGGWQRSYFDPMKAYFSSPR
jgi:uncharacterized protein YndB with AHSA1/START domain